MHLWGLVVKSAYYMCAAFLILMLATMRALVFWKEKERKKLDALPLLLACIIVPWAILAAAGMVWPVAFAFGWDIVDDWGSALFALRVSHFVGASWTALLAGIYPAVQ